MKTMTAKFAGRCRDCGAALEPGSTIIYHGKGRGVSCGTGCGEINYEHSPEDEAAGLEPGTLATDRRLARQGLTVIRFSSGESMTQNSRGRCIDAPCCGCCS